MTPPANSVDASVPSHNEPASFVGASAMTSPARSVWRWVRENWMFLVTATVVEGCLILIIVNAITGCCYVSS